MMGQGEKFQGTLQAIKFLYFCRVCVNIHLWEVVNVGVDTLFKELEHENDNLLVFTRWFSHK